MCEHCDWTDPENDTPAKRKGHKGAAPDPLDAVRCPNCDSMTLYPIYHSHDAGRSPSTGPHGWRCEVCDYTESRE